ncbi:hypothetical protein MSAR_11300 [Mycolicibacterium sarraceniae]|uniref:Uncharacterized protein n=1 Tax=Mycolicibacterium sarraceniae TaxID=1534348 RepID=A0A7I7SLX7_9MYCO|nr:hypothetical protein MSAR_11300 [Mycolicibacterium sarraceniae]
MTKKTPANVGGLFRVVVTTNDIPGWDPTWLTLVCTGCAYGTAVHAVPVSDAATYTAQQLGYGAS